MNQTEEKILALCREDGDLAWLSLAYFCEKIDQNYGAITSSLKYLVEKGILEQDLVSVTTQFTDRKSRQYYYRLKQEAK
ncbi:MAG: hypothetical protein WA977_08410 [Halobacteriota archaeon]